jgi:hypothetical protein
MQKITSQKKEFWLPGTPVFWDLIYAVCATLLKMRLRQ